MNIVILESLEISFECLNVFKLEFEAAGHAFSVYERTDDIGRQIEQSKNAEILIIADMPLRGEVIKACKKLKFIDVAFTGVDHVDIEAAKECNVKVSNASGYSNTSVAELTLCMMLSLLRNVSQVEKRAREGGTKYGLVGNELRGKTVGIIGTGVIGMTTARLCNAFGCKIIAYNGFSNKQSNDMITYMPLKEMLEQSDIVALHCPASDKSRHLINNETIAYMKPSAILINAARGAVVDSAALSEALNRGKIRAAGIDVFETEPPLNSSDTILNSKNTLVTPHIAFATKESMEKRAEIVFENIRQFLVDNHINKVC